MVNRIRDRLASRRRRGMNSAGVDHTDDDLEASLEKIRSSDSDALAIFSALTFVPEVRNNLLKALNKDFFDMHDMDSGFDDARHEK